MLLTCPACHARYSLDLILQDEAARELLSLSGQAGRAWPALVRYLGLFRSESRPLAWDRALRLAQEVLEIGDQGPGTGNLELIERALIETVDALRAKGGKPLKNHNYLKRVLENVPAGSVVMQSQGAIANATSKRASAVNALLEWGMTSWLHHRISTGLAALVARSLKGQPGADMIVLCADTWLLSLSRILTIEEIDAERVSRGFERLLAEVVEWPQPKQLVALLPSRPVRQALREPSMSDAEHAETSRRMDELLKTLG